ncbi:helicase-related protein [Lutibaculum baratangense]|uniref:ATP-depended DNA helicase n=1 Tax=Lutibaculum baratangense AMV1 TaxID=631454 RepID=V4QWJ7_9HYPH|nr:helicase-related protein [Lutibaculum baratangense]ESR24117.1 ATP- depended DNA helicase [Lutibaculum baratangense AMV1]
MIIDSRDGHQAAAPGAGVTAVLGPTNTGKTHLAIERMLGHSSGIIGLPLRLLAREVYDRLVARVGREAVALVTGEEKIKPPHARYWVSTVEAMPQDLDVAFVAVDEVQLAADLERGHVFTDRILRRRGREETLLLGAATMRGILSKLMPGINVITRPRLSMLLYSGQKKLTRLPERSAIVAFSAEEVYTIAELLRRQRGGAAVVLGALSPRTRNSQVELYQSGDVDLLVATDAIGMGLNLDVDHVAFGGLRKFDGFQFRNLNPAEMGQIAGRAGRHMRDGTFGVTGRADPLDPMLVERLEAHEFDEVRMLQWRNPDLDFASLDALRDSLAVAPRNPVLTRAPGGDDVQALETAARDPGVSERARSRKAVELLWAVCQVPDYRKIAPANHAELVSTLYRHLIDDGEIAEEWFASQVAYADRIDGDLDTLANRIAHIRTWTFVANRPEWLKDAVGWQEKTRAVEDRLSDALHERLAQRFVDRRTSVLARRLRENSVLEADIDRNGDVTVEGEHVGRLEGLRFSPDPGADKAVTAAGRKALAGELESRAEALAKASDEALTLELNGLVFWNANPVARLEKGERPLSPRIVLLADELLAGAARERAQARLEAWLASRMETLLGPLLALERDEGLAGMSRGVAFQLVEALGVLERQSVSDEVKELDQNQRGALRRHGVRFGAHHIFLPALLKPGPRVFAAQLWALQHGGLYQPGFDELVSLARSGRMSVAVGAGTSRGLYRALGYRVCGARAVRVDILERLADIIRAALAWKPGENSPAPAGAVDGRVFAVSENMTSLVGCAGEDFDAILRSLGYRSETRKGPLQRPWSGVASTAPVERRTPEAAPLEGSTAPATDAAGAPVEAADTAEAQVQALPQAGEDLPDAAAVDIAASPEGGGGAEPAAVLPEEAGTAGPEVAAATPAGAEPALPDTEEVPATPEQGATPEAIAAPAEAAEPLAEALVAEAEAEAEATAGEAGAETPAEEEHVVWRPARGGRPANAPRRQGGRGRRGGEQPAQAGAGAGTGPARDGERPEGREEARGKGRGRGQPPRKKGAPPPRPRPEGKPAPRREKEPDPDSPFAKLAALRDELAGRRR